ncbi:hypothetical protein TNIN_100141 [Trichonephila inaurata madagascariensis]|uniref:Endonuclease/exonuclease/phosphatase domain-containing protein n=1 Tax=Trichonephila inaurata madagascariensis TaxID=2747483 RepID=A0A8X7C7F6_9ARAC|nr:hypothetical protein TNIN_100141 [Trichonephila inaurata madagascariensis]
MIRRFASDVPEPRSSVAGDLNAKHASWSPHSTEHPRKYHKKILGDNTGYSLIAPSEPTFIRQNYNSTTIDIAICKGMTVTDCSSISEL